jgi:Transcriptional regulators of sugar metabolism
MREPNNTRQGRKKLMLTHERQERILDYLKTNSTVSVNDLSASLDVSQATIRRTLDQMNKLGIIQRIHGGATLARRAEPEPPVVQRNAKEADEKHLIGQACAALIQDGETVFIGSGTTALQVARCLTGGRDLTVITNSLLIVEALSQEKNISVISIGGMLRQTELSFIGYLAEQALRELRPQKVIMSIRAISLVEGLTNDYLPEVSTDRVIIKSAPEVILVADHTKFGKVSTAFVAPLTSIHRIVTDSETPLDTINQLKRSSIDVIIA